MRGTTIPWYKSMATSSCLDGHNLNFWVNYAFSPLTKAGKYPPILLFNHFVKVPTQCMSSPFPSLDLSTAVMLWKDWRALRQSWLKALRSEKWDSYWVNTCLAIHTHHQPNATLGVIFTTARSETPIKQPCRPLTQHTHSWVNALPV